MSGKLSICAALYEVRYLYIDMGCYCGYNAMVLPFYFVLYNTTYNPANTIFHYKSGASYSVILPTSTTYSYFSASVFTDMKRDFSAFMRITQIR